MGSFPVDIDLRIDPRSALKAYNEFTTQAKAMMAQVSAGVEGADKKLMKLQEDFGRNMISTSTKAGRAVESSIKSLERQAEIAGKTRSEQLLMRQEKWIKMLGEDEAAIKRVTAAFQQLIKVEDEEQRKKGTGGLLSTGTTANLMFRASKDVFEGRGAYATMNLATVFARMREGGALGGAGGAGAAGAGAGVGAITMGVVGLTAAFAGLEVAGGHAAKAMGDYAEHLREIQGITGMTVVEVQKLEYVAQASGHTIEDVEKGMRGLTQALEGGGTKAIKVGQELKSMNVDVLGLRTGTLSTFEALQQIGEALEKSPDLWKTNSEMMDIFKKSGLNLKYVLKELADSKAFTGKLSLFSEAEVQEMDKMDKRFDEIGARTEIFFKRLKFWMAQRFEADVNLVVKLTNIAGQIIEPIAEGVEIDINWLRKAGLLPAEQKAPYTEGELDAERSWLKGQRKQRMDVRGEQFSQFLKGTAARGLEGAEQKLRDLETQQKELRENTPANMAKFVQDPEAFLAHERAVTEELRKQKNLVEAIRNAESDRKNIIEALRQSRESVADRMRSPFELAAEAELRKKLEMRGVKGTPAAGDFQAIYGPLIDFEKTQRDTKLATQMLETRQNVQRQMDRAALGGITPVNIRALGEGGVTRADVEQDINRQMEQRQNIAMETFQKERQLIQQRVIDAKDTVGLEQQRRDIVTATGNLAIAQIEAENARKKEMYALDDRQRELERTHRITMSRIQLADQEESIKHDADLERKRAELRFKGENPAAGIVESYRIAVTESQQLYDLEMQRIQLHETGFKAEEDAAIALHRLHKDTLQAREEGELKLAQMQMQQLETLKGKIAPLYETLFKDPKNFGKQLQQTVTDAALRPVIGGLSEMTATALHPLIYGAGGTGGGLADTMRGMFGGGGRLNDVKLTSDGAVPVHIVNMGGGGGGLMPAGTNIFSTGGWGGGGWTGGGAGGFGMGIGPGGTPGFAPGPLGIGPSMTMGPGIGGGDMSAGGGGVAMGGGPSFEQLANLPTGTPNYGAAMSRMALGAALSGSSGGGTAGGVGGSFLGLASTLRGNWQMALGLNRSYGSTGSMLKGMAGSPLAKAGAMTGGMMLAQHGLLGGNRGTVGGIFEGALGGAGIGFAMGGPLGAAIGAGVGLGIGIGEMIAGVETPEREAKRLVQQLYHISINNQAAAQIVSIAKSSYAGRVSIAVRSPEVRHMLGLYAAGTGQASQFAGGSSEARGASLVESGGTLSQQARYQYGNAYTYGSNLPVYGGGGSLPLSAPGGGMQLSLNIGGQDAARFMTGHVVTPDVVQSQYASAMYSSSGRVRQALMMNEPGSIAS